MFFEPSHYSHWQVCIKEARSIDNGLLRIHFLDQALYSRDFEALGFRSARSCCLEDNYKGFMLYSVEICWPSTRLLRKTNSNA